MSIFVCFCLFLSVSLSLSLSLVNLLDFWQATIQVHILSKSFGLLLYSCPCLGLLLYSCPCLGPRVHLFTCDNRTYILNLSPADDTGHSVLVATFWHLSSKGENISKYLLLFLRKTIFAPNLQFSQMDLFSVYPTLSLSDSKSVWLSACPTLSLSDSRPVWLSACLTLGLSVSSTSCSLKDRQNYSLF